MSDYLVLLETAWLVRDVKSIDDAANIAISEIGKRLNPKLSFVEFEIGRVSCQACGETFEKIFLIAETALVGIIFEMKVFSANDEKHATQIAKSVIGSALKNASLKVINTEGLGD